VGAIVQRGVRFFSSPDCREQFRFGQLPPRKKRLATRARLRGIPRNRTSGGKGG
jgi:hypothetical protein